MLAPHGSIAVELGDTFSGSGGGGGDYLPGGMRDGQNVFGGSAKTARRADAAHWPLPKSLCGIPTLYSWSLAYGRNLLTEPMSAGELLGWIDRLRAAGYSAEQALAVAGGWVAEHGEPHRFDPWRIRNVIVWARNNPPVGALADKVRPAVSYITVATKSRRRWFDLEAVRSPGSPNTHARAPKGVRRNPQSGKAIADGRGGNWDTLDELAEITGAPPTDYWADEYDATDLAWLINTQGSSLDHYAMWPPSLAERLILSMCPPGGTVLDPFAGTGTTLAVADLHGRDAIGIDLDPANPGLYQQRYEECERALFPNRPVVHPGQSALEFDV